MGGFAGWVCDDKGNSNYICKPIWCTTARQDANFIYGYLENFFLINVISKPLGWQKVTWFNANYQKLPHYDYLPANHRTWICSIQTNKNPVFSQ